MDSDVKHEAYKKRKREYAKTPEQREKRKLYMREWTKKNREHANKLAYDSHNRSRIKRGLEPFKKPMSPEEAKEKKRLAMAERRKQNREKFNRQSNIAYHKHKHKYAEKVRNDRLKRKYGITQEDYLKMLSDQKGCCKICGKDNNGIKRFHIDHNHKTGAVRGLLCNWCNTALGWFETNEANAIKYLGGVTW